MKLSDRCYKITEDKLNRYGSIWWQNKIDLRQPLELNFILYLGTKDATGADGIAFLFHNDPRGFNATGAVAGGLGYGIAAEFPNTPPIIPSVAIEFDTYDNNNDQYNQGFDYGDVPADHSTVVYNGQVSKPAFAPVWINSANPDVENSQCQTYRITWNPATLELKLFFNNQLRFSHTGDLINDVFKGESSVYYGFTGSTGGLSNEQTICLLDPESAPEAQDDVATTEPAKPVTIPVTQNDSHSRGEQIAISSIVNQPKNGLVTLSGQNIIYTPAEGFSGTDTFTYEICEASSTKCYSRCTTATVSVTVACKTQLISHAISASGPTALCNKGSVNLSVPEQAGITYQWKQNGKNIGTNSPGVAVSERGEYTIEFSNECGQVNGSNTLVITESLTPEPVAISASGPTTVCGNGNVMLTVPQQDGITYQWQKDGKPVGSNSNAYTATENGVYTIELINDCGTAKGSNSINFIINPEPAPVTITADGPTNFCGNGRVILSVPVQSGIRYEWQLNGQSTGSNSNTLTTSTSGEYSLHLTNDCGTIAATNKITVNSQAMLSAPVAGTSERCGSGRVTLSATGGVNGEYQWYTTATGATAIPEATAGTYVTPTLQNNTTYYVSLVHNGCESLRVPVQVTIHPLPMVTAGPDVTIDRGENTILKASEGKTYLWQPSTGLSNPTEASPTARPEETTTYTVKVASAGGCTAEAQVTVTVRQDLIIPTAISPNGDGMNEYWEITNIDKFPNARLEIFNRWGNKIYDVTGYRNNWNGTWKGSSLPMGTYFYVITLDKGRKLTGPISIIL